MNRTLGKAVLTLGGCCVAVAAQALPQFSDVPVDAGTGLPFTAEQLANSMAFSGAKALQDKLVTSSIKRQSLEGLTANATAGTTGLGLTFGSSSGSTSQALLTGAGKVDNNPFTQGENGSEFLGRFNTTLGTADPATAKFWESQSQFTIKFTDGTTFDAFGFYGTDFGDFNGTFELSLLIGDEVKLTRTIPVGSPGGVAPLANDAGNGSLQFIGFYDDAQRYTGVRFTIRTTSVSDYLGFDDFFIGDYNRSTGGTTPEPGSLALVGASLLGLAAARRRRAA